MIRTRLLFLLFIPVSAAFFACGIDDYIYLKPVTETDWRPSNQQITFTLPTSQTDDYFKEYVIYYRLYPSAVTKSGISFSIGDFSSINSAMYSDYLSIFPYSIEDDEAPVYLESLFENTLAFKELSFGTPVISKTGLSMTVDETDELDTPLIDENRGKTATIDYNLLSLGTAHPCLIINNTKYRLFRENASDPKPSHDFLQYNGMSGEDIEGSAASYTYAVFYIVAKGIDDTFSTILSRAAFLGALQLPEEPDN